MFERPQSGERAILVHAGPDGAPDDSEREEFVDLARSAGAIIVDQIVSARKRPDPRYFIGKGKVDEITSLRRDEEVDVVIFDVELTPRQLNRA